MFEILHLKKNMQNLSIELQGSRSFFLKKIEFNENLIMSWLEPQWMIGCRTPEGLATL